MKVKDDKVTRNTKGSVEKDEQEKDETNQSLAQDPMIKSKWTRERLDPL